jgi:hypothetical protein
MDPYGHNRASFDFITDGEQVSATQLVEKIIAVCTHRKQSAEILFTFQYSPP